MAMPEWNERNDGSSRAQALQAVIEDAAAAGLGILTSQGFRLALLGGAIFGLAAFVGNPFEARAPLAVQAASQTGISPSEPRLYRRAVQTQSALPENASPLLPAAFTPPAASHDDSHAIAICEAFDGNGLTTPWGPSPLFVGEKECHATIKHEAYRIAAVARGVDGVDVMRLTLTLADPEDREAAGHALSKRLKNVLDLEGVEDAAEVIDKVAALNAVETDLDGYHVSFFAQMSDAAQLNLVLQRSEDESTVASVR